MGTPRDDERMSLAHADLLLLMADLLRPPGRVELPTVPEVMPLIETIVAGERNTPLRQAIIELLDNAAKTPWVRWSDEYHRLFEGPIACPINETTYVRRDKGAIIADICGFYRAFGFKPSPDDGEKPDHLRCELEFLAALLVMEAQAVERGMNEPASITRDAITRFADDHPAEWIASFCARLMEVTKLAVYGRLAEVLPLVWETLAGRLHLPALRPGDPAAGEHEEIELDPMPCGTGAQPDPTALGAQPRCGLTIEGVGTPPGTTDERSESELNSRAMEEQAG